MYPNTSFGPSDFNFGGAAGSPVMSLPNAGASNPVGAALQNIGGAGASSDASGVAAAGGVAGVNVNNPAASPLGMNMGTMNLVLGGIQAIGNIWNAFQANKLAKDQFAFQKDVTETNLANQIKSYNTTLGDRIRSRAYTEGGQAGGLTQAGARSYMEEHSLSRKAA